MQEFYYWKQQYELQKPKTIAKDSDSDQGQGQQSDFDLKKDKLKFQGKAKSGALCCIGCGEPVESIFTVECKQKSQDKAKDKDTYSNKMWTAPHVLRASCGSKTQPCSFHIHVQCSAACSAQRMLQELRDQIHRLEQELIRYKNDILFGYEHMDVQKYKEMLEQLTECRRKQQEWGQRIMYEQGRTLEQQEAYRDASILFHRNLLSQLKERMNHIHQGIVESQITELVQFYRGEIQHSVGELRKARCDDDHHHGQLKEWIQPILEIHPSDSKTLALSVPFTFSSKIQNHDTTVRKENQSQSQSQSQFHPKLVSKPMSKTKTQRVLKTMIRLEE